MSTLFHSFVFFSVCLTVSFIGALQIADAQIFRGAPTLSIEIAPAYPGPNEPFTATVRSFGVNLTTSAIGWTVNGQAMGQNERLLRLTAPSAGTSMSIRLSLTTEDGSIFSAERTVRPGNIDLLWEAESSYTPPFYKGKALPTTESAVEIVAVPHLSTVGGREYAPSELVFTWELNGQTVAAASGKGRDRFTVAKPNFYRSDVVRVFAAPPDGTGGGVGTLALLAGEPRVILYESDPLLGINYQYAVDGTFELAKEEGTFVAHPVFFPTYTRADSRLSYEWTLNGSPLEPQGSDPSSITFRQTGEGGGEADVTVMVTNQLSTPQRVAATFRLLFSIPSGSFF